jgi:hypothetical protein
MFNEIADDFVGLAPGSGTKFRRGGRRRMSGFGQVYPTPLPTPTYYPAPTPTPYPSAYPYAYAGTANLPKTVAAAKKQYGVPAYTCPVGGGVRINENLAQTYCSHQGMLATISGCLPNFSWYCDPSKPMQPVRGTSIAPSGQVGSAGTGVLPTYYPTPTPSIYQPTVYPTQPYQYPTPITQPYPYASYPQYPQGYPMAYQYPYQASPYSEPLLTPIDGGGSYDTSGGDGGIPGDIYGGGVTYGSAGPLLTPISDGGGGDNIATDSTTALEENIVEQSQAQGLPAGPAPNQPPAALASQCSQDASKPPTVDQYGPLQTVQVVCAQGQVAPPAPTQQDITGDAMSGLGFFGATRAKVPVRGRYIG